MAAVPQLITVLLVNAAFLSPLMTIHVTGLILLKTLLILPGIRFTVQGIDVVVDEDVVDEDEVDDVEEVVIVVEVVVGCVVEVVG